MLELPSNCKAFTTSGKSILNQLKNTAIVRCGGKEIKVDALWDTGATMTNISQEVVKALGLVPTGRQRMLTPSGSYDAPTYLIDVELPNQVIIKDLRVCSSEIGSQRIGLLIGMDIISTGDFAVSNYNGKTVFTFRSPSAQVTDYYKQIVAANAMGPRHGTSRGKKKR